MKPLTMAEKKEKMIELVRRSKDEELINRLFNIVQRVDNVDRPCQHPVWDLQRSADRAIADVEAGKLLDPEIVEGRFGL